MLIKGEDDGMVPLATAKIEGSPLKNNRKYYTYKYLGKTRNSRWNIKVFKINKKLL